jgi:Domain of unknown function (DUF4352)
MDYATLFAAMSRLFRSVPGALTSSLLIGFVTLLAGCSGAKKESVVFPAGDKIPVGSLTYNVIDTEVLPKLGDDPATARTPSGRFYLVTISVSNSGNDDAVIPALNLVDDKGQDYAELADGSGVPNWLGVVRKVGGTQTEKGTVVFDAPPQHYKLRLTDEADARQLYVDIPLNYLHEQLRDANQQTPSGDSAVPLVLPNKK